MDAKEVQEWHEKQADYYSPFGAENAITVWHAEAAQTISDLIAENEQLKAQIRELKRRAKETDRKLYGTTQKPTSF